MCETYGEVKRFSRNWLYLGVALVPMLMTAPAMAAEDLEDVVVSANRTATPIKQTASSVTVITAQEIEEKQFVTVKEIIETVPGVTYSSNGGVGTNSYTFIRGMSAGSGHVKMMIDGIEVDTLSHVMASDVDRVEVLKGNQSSLYGADAIGGVISITTKSGKNSNKLIEGSAFAEFGSFHTYRTGANILGRYGKVYYSGGLTQYDSDSIDIAKHVGGNENDGYENFTANMRIGADLIQDYGVLDKLNVEYLFRFVDSHVEYDGWSSGTGLFDRAYDGSTVMDNNHSWIVRADMYEGLISNEFKASYNTKESKYNQTGTAAFGAASRNQHTKYEYKSVITPNEMHTIVAGADYEKESIGNGGTQRSMHGLYANYQVDLLDEALTLTFGTRLDKVDSVDSELTYRTTANYNLEDTGTRFHASYGTGFKAPSVRQLTGGGSTVRNNLDPERSRGYDIGVEQSFMDDRIVFDTTFFNTRLRDLITYVSGSSPNSVYENINGARTYGFETTLSVEATDELDFQVTHTYQEAKNLSADSALSLRPGHAGNLQVNYRPDYVDGLSTWVRANYQGANWDQYGANRDFIGGYVVWDMGANYEWDYGITFYGRVENMFDKHYEVKSDYAEPGMAATLGARVKF